MPENETKYPIGVIHGRFQVLHYDHLAYLLAGKALCRHLVVGVTNPDPFLTRTEDADPQRSHPIKNPLTYYERYVMVNQVLLEAGLGGQEFSVVPLPINLPDRYRFYVPMDAVFFLTIYDDWGRRKLDYLQSQGLATHVLRDVPPHQKGISAVQVREAMMNDQPWEHLVPACVPPLMESWGIPARLKQLKAGISR
jgi:nicotinamide-nucleotide adenylyltransferase